VRQPRFWLLRRCGSCICWFVPPRAAVSHGLPPPTGCRPTRAAAPPHKAPSSEGAGRLGTAVSGQLHPTWAKLARCGWCPPPKAPLLKGAAPLGAEGFNPNRSSLPPPWRGNPPGSSPPAQAPSSEGPVPPTPHRLPLQRELSAQPTEGAARSPLSAGVVPPKLLIALFTSQYRCEEQGGAPRPTPAVPLLTQKRNQKTATRSLWSNP